MAEKTVSNATPKAILDACAESGIDTRVLLSEAGITDFLPDDPVGRTPFDDVVRLWEVSSKRTQDRMIGVNASKYAPFGAYKVVDYMMPTGQTPREGISKSLRYYPLINKGLHLQVNFDGKDGYIEMQNLSDPDVIPFQYVDFVFALISARIRISSLLDQTPAEIQLTCREPADSRGYDDFFRTRVRFRQRSNRMVFERQYLDNPLPNSDAGLFEMLDSHARCLVKKRPPERDVLYELSRILRANLPTGGFDLNRSARTMGMSRRSLQRKLNKQGVTYRQILDKIRCEVSVSLLKKEDIGVEEIGFLVGYSEKRAFQRAFKQWTGTTPRKYINR
jgi:AraC-like DNA-binding protein